MWFRRRDRVRETAQKIVEGLRNGTLVLDPPFAKDKGVALPPAESFERGAPVATASLAGGVFASFVVTPEAVFAAPRPRRETSATVLDAGDVVVAGIAGYDRSGYALL